MRPSPNHSLRGSRGFSLVELMIVLSLIGTLAGFFMQNARSAMNESRATACEKNRQLLADAAGLFHAREGRWPDSIDELREAGYATERARCPDGGEYVFEVTDPSEPYAFQSIVCARHGGMRRIDRHRGAASQGGPAEEVDIWALDEQDPVARWAAFKELRSRNDANERDRQSTWRNGRKAQAQAETTRRRTWAQDRREEARTERKTRKAFDNKQAAEWRDERRARKQFARDLKKADADDRKDLWAAERGRRKQWQQDRIAARSDEMARRRDYNGERRSDWKTEKGTRTTYDQGRKTEREAELQRRRDYQTERKAATERERARR